MKINVFVREKAMASKRIILGILVLVYLMIIVGCKNDSRENGTITIAGIDDRNGYKAVIYVLSDDGKIAARGEGNISNNSVTILLVDDKQNQFTGNGLYILELFLSYSGYPGSVNSEQYLYTNGQTWERLGIDENYFYPRVLEKIQKYNISSTASTISFDKFQTELYWDNEHNYLTPSDNSTQLIVNQWEDGGLSGANSEDWYSFSVINGQTYYIWWNDKFDGDNTKTADILAVAVYSDGRIIFNEDSGWKRSNSFIANRTSAVYVRVSSFISGTYGIVYSDSSIRPDY